MVFVFIFVLFFSVLHLQHMEVPRLGGQSELQMPVCATATWDLSHICNLHHSSQQCWILNPLSKARDGTCVLMDTSWVCNPLSHKGNSWKLIFKISDEILLYSTGNYIQSLVMEHEGGKCEKKNIYIYIYDWVTLLYSRKGQNTVNQL